MWTCLACGLPNELHAIFCSSCGVSRHKAVRRDLPEPEPAVASIPPPVFRGTVAGFALLWTGVALATVAVGSLLNVHSWSRFDSSGTSKWSDLLFRLVSGTATVLLYSGVSGILQSWILRRRTGRRGWSLWIAATVGGLVVPSIASTLVPLSMWQGGSLSKFAVHPIAGAVAGGFLGLLQSWVLSRVLGSPPGTRWVAINAGLYAFSWTMTPLVWKGLISWLEWEMGAVMIYWTGYLALISGGKAAVAGVVLGRILRRSATSPPRASLPSG